MCTHYLFDADFCNVASGWKKGVVEKNVQDCRKRIWLDAQSRKWRSFEELNAWLGERCRALWSEIRHPEYKQFNVAEMLEQERTELMPMPAAVDGYVERSAKVSSTCLVVVAKNRYLVPCELGGQRVSIRLYPSQVEIATDEAIVARHARLTHHCHIVETGNESYWFRHSTMAAKTPIKAREIDRKDSKAAPATAQPEESF